MENTKRRRYQGADSTMIQHDVVILGGGPAGSTAATLLAARGLDVVVLEKAHFPRFHIGESLLPGTVAIFERLGIHEQIRDAFIHKPGGKWLYGSKEVTGDFSKSDRNASFKGTPYSYLVERSVFDEILIRRSMDVGADVRFGVEVRNTIIRAGRVVGVQGTDEEGQPFEIFGRLVIDATGLRAFVSASMGKRKITQPQRMGIYAQYLASPGREDIEAGWFTGQMFYDGWTWLLKLPRNRYSVGAVLTVDRFRKSGRSPAELLEHLVAENELLTTGMGDGHERISDVMVTGNMGSTSGRLCGEGWVAVGDAAFFIDPCYSSGVHLAMKSGEAVADLVSDAPTDIPVPASLFEQYEADMRRHERSVHRMVDAFYLASRYTSVQKMVTTFQGGWFSRKFVTFVGGDFNANSAFISRVRFYSETVGSIFGNDSSRDPSNHPNYLHRNEGESDIQSADSVADQVIIEEALT
ncbi:MAG: NAD(P)/FAD-dependent oxidoreductase [Fuerstiella sp.]|nr:NAD(P)/FAD-dependent oxidoreductase [Fuerstiella sp.]